MIAKFRLLPLSTFCFLACIFFFAAPPRAHAQFGGQTITCSSDNGRRNVCNADTRGGVQMVRQRSGSPCIQNQTWGWDNRGIWVDRGCRADFTTGRSTGPGGGGVGQTISCASNNGRRNVCNVNTRGGVQMVRQASGSPCIQGQTWGWDGQGIWVDRGCRADFVVGTTGNWSGGGGRPGNWNQGQNQNNWNQGGQTFSCASNDGRRNTCNIPGGGRNVVMTRQVSGSACVQGQTWGISGQSVWVDRGCRAEFSTAGRR